MQHAAKQEELEFQMLRKLQGIHAPLRIKMERMAVKDVGHLPCFHRHNALLDALTGIISNYDVLLFEWISRKLLPGNDKTMEFEDFLNCPRDVEVAGTPHMVIEKQLGML